MEKFYNTMDFYNTSFYLYILRKIIRNLQKYVVLHA